mmetsp:Transcript_36847/g.110466  ORF Transcript_36847/g.110466 Transcript_36847/m.110466 type:complete len:150 (-) Transcript_36847:82-531(-)
MREDLDMIMEEHRPVQQGFSSVESGQHPYLSQMRPFDGGYAILMAFHAAGRDELTKRDILRHAESYAMVDMSPDFYSGRLRCGWDCMASLEKHGFVVRRGGMNSSVVGRCDTFFLTEEGFRFIAIMVEKFGATRGVEDVGKTLEAIQLR